MTSQLFGCNRSTTWWQTPYQDHSIQSFVKLWRYHILEGLAETDPGDPYLICNSLKRLSGLSIPTRDPGTSEPDHDMPVIPIHFMA